MSRNIVICADGTGSSFARRRSNVARMIRLLALDDHRRQVAVYDQGIGTDARRWQEILRFRAIIPDRDALHVLSGPHESRVRPLEWLALTRGLAFGDGLSLNVGQLYGALAALWREGDRVFLFGFSRGAFTVRALAGLLYRCGLPRADRADLPRLIERAWRLFVPMRRPEDVADFRARTGQSSCPIHFLGLWDTVKSYGGLRPIMLPHLRHNPTVIHVRHALALDERRGWFDATTWGGLDLDRRPGAAWSRLSAAARRAIETQDIEEVWFRGCHADVGGGSRHPGSGRIALRWMLGEASHQGLRLNDAGVRRLRVARFERARIHESRSWMWRLVEAVPRHTIDNSGRWPAAVTAPRGAVPRRPEALLRDGRVTVHETTGMAAGPAVRVVSTRTAAPVVDAGVGEPSAGG